MKEKKLQEITSATIGFETLVSLFQSTHDTLQKRAVQSVNQALVIRNWLFGWYLVEYEQSGFDRAEYGTRMIETLAKRLTFRGASATNLRKCREFYRAFPIQQTLSVKLDSITVNREILGKATGQLGTRLPLSWSHYVTLLTINSADERQFYEIETQQNNWSVRELERQINSSLYQRLALSRDKDQIRRLSTEGQVVTHAADLIKDPLVLEFLNLDEKSSYSEKELETAIIDKLQAFMLELGKGFLFEARQRRFTFDAKHYYVDLVLYNRLLRCYVLIDLKLEELTHADLGQMQMYVNYYDRYVKLDEELPTIGIVLCARKNEAMVELTLPQDANIFASRYQLYLPSKEELKRELEKIEAEIEAFGLEAKP